MTLNEIKKALYKEKPIAFKARMKAQDKLPEQFRGFDIYIATLSTGAIVEFKIPLSELPDGGFGDKESAQLLIRWLSVA